MAEAKSREIRRQVAIQQWDKKWESAQNTTQLPVMPDLQGGSPPRGGEPPIEEKKEQKKPAKKAKSNKRDNEAAEKVAKQAQVSARTLYRAKAVDEEAPELKEAVLHGEMSLAKAYTVVQSEKKSEELKEAIESGRSLTDLEIMQKLDITVQPLHFST